ncbi:MAG: right-handed parallel beta-helix repeat-containing protein, partial [Oscillospiraceae bacterium]|nr:right-handed parallel beta-helix repeat-containing protein [Oscillospiraceae bacterium]
MKKRLVSLLLALALFVTLLPAVTLSGSADTVVGYHSTDGQTWTSYTNTTSLINTIHKQSGTHYVKMEADWNLKSTINDRITINSSANITIYMQGHVIDRGLTSAGSYGNVFLVEAGATLVLDGGTETEQQARHLDSSNQPTIKGYNVSTASPGTLTLLSGASEIKGAVLTGAYTKQDGGVFGVGASYYGGAIQMLGADTSVRLISVTVVGNRTNFGGGAINVDSTGNTITLENSRLIYNYAGEHGGGIRMNGTQFDNILNAYTCTLKMTNSSISNNYSGRNGGGIETDAVLTLRGDGSSYISDNVCAGYNNGSNYGGGGGIDVYKGAASISGVIIDNNKTNSYQGGGVLIEGSADSEIKNCTITNNQALGSYGKGGGVFLKYGGSTISDCTVSGNSAASGSGVYLDSTDSGATVNLGGMLHITGNTTSNLYLSAGTYISPNQTGSSVIGITAADVSGDRQLSKDAGTYATAPYVYDGGGYGFKWYNQPTDARYRYLYIVSSGADTMPTDQPLDLDSAQEVSGGYNSGAYKLIKAAYSTSSAADSVNENDAVCFYSDGYFFDDPTLYNEHLASMSMALVTSGFTTNWGSLHTQYYTGTAPDAKLTAVRYNNKHAHIRQLLANLGFSDADFYANEMELSEPMMDTIGVAISHKALKTADNTDTGKILVPVVVRSNGYEDEWASNFTLGAGGETVEGEALGFATAANMVYSELLDYIDNYGLTAAAQQGRLIFWVVGYSRGGATANLVARRLIDGASPTIDVSTVLSDTNAGAPLSKYVTGSSMTGRAFAIGDNQVISYTFEAPQGGTDAAQAFLTSHPEKYFTLHNAISAIDPVPYVAMTAFGFKRYGIDHYLPGLSTLATTGLPAEESAYTFTYADFTHTVVKKMITAGGRTITTYRDNDYLVVPVDTTSNSAENAAYLPLRAEMLRQYQLLNPYMIYDDYFAFAEINYSSAVFGSGFNPTVTCSMSREAYTAYLIQKVVDWKATSRTVYTSPFVLNNKTHSSYQGAIRDVFKTIYGLTPQQTEAFSDALRTTMSSAGIFGSNVGLFGSAINVTDIGTIINTLENYGSLDEAGKEEDLEDLWSKLVKLGLLDAVPADAKARLEEDWYTLGDLLLTMLYQDRNDPDVATSMGDNRRVLGTALYNYSRMFLNHYSETVMAWLRTYDDYYANESVHYVITRPTSVAQPAGEAVNAHGIASAVTADAAATEVVGTVATLYLDVADIGGEAIYYTVSGFASVEQTYNGRNGIALSGSLGDTVTVNAYAMSYGVKSRIGAYRIKFTACQHENTTLTGAVAATCTTAGYSGDYVCDTCGETVTAGVAVSALGHTGVYADNGDGTHDETCSVCGTILTDDEAHDYSGGVCTLCGAEEPVVETLAIVSRSLVLNGKIDVVYTVKVPEGYGNPR